MEAQKYLENKIEEFFKECETMKQTFCCEHCYSKVPIEKTYKADCGHRFCIDCLKSQIINSTIYPTPIRCEKCRKPIDLKELYVLGLIENKETIVNYLSRNIFVEERQHFNECPKCHLNVYSPETNGKVTCPNEECKTELCVKCGEHWHEGKTCEEIVDLKRSQDENLSSSLEWVEKNTKRCPKCSNAIQFNKGCFIMNCRCGCQFCWSCGLEISGYEHFANNTTGCVVFSKEMK